MTPQEFHDAFERQPPTKRARTVTQLDRLLAITGTTEKKFDPSFNQFDRNFLKTLRISAE